MAQFPYKRLPGRCAGLFSVRTLWMADDHLLSVHSHRVTEQYRRFYFRDIQAICIQANASTGYTYLDWWVLGSGVFVIAALAVTDHPFWSTFAAICTAVYMTIRGLRATCTTWVQTAVGTERLPSLRRIRPASKAAALIEECVLQAQADIQVSPVVETGGTAEFHIAPAPPALPRLLDTPPPLPVERVQQPNALYAAAFVAVALTGALKIASASWHAPAFVWMLPLGYVASVVLLTVPLFRGRLARLPGPQRTPVLGALMLSGLLGMWSVGFVTQQYTATSRDPNVDKVYRAIDGSIILTVIPGTLLVACGVWGMVVFGRSSEAGALLDPQTITLFPADRQ